MLMPPRPALASQRLQCGIQCWRNYSEASSHGDTTVVATPGNYSIGQIVAALPAGCITPTVQGTTYYLCGNTWFSAAYGANGVYYRVVPCPGG